MSFTARKLYPAQLNDLDLTGSNKIACKVIKSGKHI